MITQRYFSIIFLIFTSLTSLADKRMTVENIDTGEFFEVTIPDGVRISAYNSNWLDSVPYIIEHTMYAGKSVKANACSIETQISCCTLFCK